MVLMTVAVRLGARGHLAVDIDYRVQVDISSRCSGQCSGDWQIQDMTSNLVWHHFVVIDIQK